MAGSEEVDLVRVNLSVPKKCAFLCGGRFFQQLIQTLRETEYKNHCPPVTIYINKKQTYIRSLSQIKPPYVGQILTTFVI